MMQTHLSHPYTAVYPREAVAGGGIPYALQWAFALVRSRAFTAGPDLFAFVPFLDMVRDGAIII